MQRVQRKSVGKFSLELLPAPSSAQVLLAHLPFASRREADGGGRCQGNAAEDGGWSLARQFCATPKCNTIVYAGLRIYHGTHNTSKRCAGYSRTIASCCMDNRILLYGQSDIWEIFH